MSGGVKRDRDGNARSKSGADAPRGQFHDMFEGFRNELDEHHDRKERITKTSRDVTALAKKIIFSLQRVKEPNKEFSPHVQKEIDARLAEITEHLTKIAPDLQSINRYRYAWQMRCLDELVEAVSLAHYLRHQTIITQSEAQATIPSGIPLTHLDYLWGIFDLSGEMMRFATVTTAQTGTLVGRVGGRNILGDLQELRYELEKLPEIPTKEYKGKMDVMRQSVQKVEKLGYGLVVRGSERPKGWLPDMKDEAPDTVEPV